MSTRESKILLSDESIEEKALVTFRIFLFGFNIKIAKVILRKYFYVLAINITISHSNGCTSNTPSLSQPNTSSQQNYTPISAKFTAVGRELVECTLDVLSVPVVRWCEVYIGCAECTGC